MCMKTDETLWAEFQAGDETAFAEIDERFRGPLGRYCSARLQSDVDGEDVVQRTFLEMIQDKDKLAPGKFVQPWLYTIADRLVREKQAAGRQAAKVLASPEMEVLAEAFER